MKLEPAHRRTGPARSRHIGVGVTLQTNTEYPFRTCCYCLGDIRPGEQFWRDAPTEEDWCLDCHDPEWVDA